VSGKKGASFFFIIIIFNSSALVTPRAMPMTLDSRWRRGQLCDWTLPYDSTTEAGWPTGPVHKQQQQQTKDCEAEGKEVTDMYIHIHTHTHTCAPLHTIHMVSYLMGKGKVRP